MGNLWHVEAYEVDRRKNVRFLTLRSHAPAGGDLLIPGRVRMGAMRTPLLLALALTVAVTACDFFQDPDSGFRERAARQLAQAERSWDSLAVHDYDFSYLKQCDCPSASTAVRIEVRGDNVQRVTDEAGVDLTGQTSMQWPTVDSLFARARAILADESVTVQILFDSVYSFPVLVQSFREANGELIRHVSDGLVPITP